MLIDLLGHSTNKQVTSFPVGHLPFVVLSNLSGSFFLRQGALDKPCRAIDLLLVKLFTGCFRACLLLEVDKPEFQGFPLVARGHLTRQHLPESLEILLQVFRQPVIRETTDIDVGVVHWSCALVLWYKVFNLNLGTVQNSVSLIRDRLHRRLGAFGCLKLNETVALR